MSSDYSGEKLGRKRFCKYSVILNVCLKAGWNAIDLYVFDLFPLIYPHLNISMSFDGTTLFVLWHISYSVGVLIIKTTFSVVFNRYFVLRLRNINFILNSIIQFINSFLCFLHLASIILCIKCSFFIIKLCFQCAFIMFELIRKNPKIRT